MTVEERAGVVVAAIKALIPLTDHADPLRRSHTDAFTDADPLGPILKQLRAAVAEEREACAAMLLKTKGEGGTIYPHACASCGLTDEERAVIETERRILKRAAAAIRARSC